MREMIYSMDAKKEILDEGIYKDFHYVILNLGWHPTAYVEIPKTHPYYGKDYDECDISCHGGLTYSGNAHWQKEDDGKFYLGWDYAHCGDYSGIRIKWEGTELQDYGRHWTTVEILEEVEDVIEQLKEIK